MTNSSHLASSALIYLIGCSVIESPPTIQGVVATAAGSLLPDIDLPTSAIGRPFFPIASWINRKIGHRTLTHSILGILLFGFVALLIGWALRAWLDGSSSYARFLTLGFASHVMVDTLNKMGVELFFDPRDLVQVKYEMLRRVQKGGESVSQTAIAFGFSRPSFYQAQAAFEEAGLIGLVPQKRGPRQGHKLTPDVVEFIRQQREADPSLRMPALLASVKERFGIDLHPRTIERGLARTQKKRRNSG